MGVQPTICLDLKLIYGVPSLQDTDNVAKWCTLDFSGERHDAGLSDLLV
jgi:hypothetical protein